MVKWGPIDVGQSISFYLQANTGSKEQITLKSLKVGDYYCFPIVLEGEDTVKMLPLNEQYDANLIQEIESSGTTETTLCKLSKVPYTKKDGTQGGKLQFSVVKTTENSTSDDLPPLEEYLKDPEASQSTNSQIVTPINANKTQAQVPQRKDGQTMGMCFKIACDKELNGSYNIHDFDRVEQLTRTLYASFQVLMSE